MTPRWRRSVALVVTALVLYAVIVFLALPALPMWVTGSATFNVAALGVALVGSKWLVLDGGFQAYGIDPFGLQRDGEE